MVRAKMLLPSKELKDPLSKGLSHPWLPLYPEQIKIRLRKNPTVYLHIVLEIMLYMSLNTMQPIKHMFLW